MFRKTGLLGAALAMFSIAGGPWAVLQSVAWVQMIGDYAQSTGSVAVAVARTFDGQHPCDLCREIRTAKTREHHHDSSTAPAGKESAQAKALLAESGARLPGRTATKITLPWLVAPSGVSRTDPPPTPPPRRGGLAA